MTSYLQTAEFNSMTTEFSSFTNGSVATAVAGPVNLPDRIGAHSKNNQT